MKKSVIFKIVSATLALAVLLSVLPSCGSSRVIAEGMSGESITWSVTAGGVLTISGAGAMSDFADYVHDDKIETEMGEVDPYVKTPWNYYRKSIRSVVIDAGITSIGRCAFAGFTKLKSVSISSTVKTINERAFYNCVALKEIDIPSNVISIGDYAFCNCPRLERVGLPSELLYIGSSAFFHCSNLKSIEFPSKLNVINGFAFSGCSKLVDIVIPDSVYYIGTSAFLYCNKLTTAKITSPKWFYKALSLVESIDEIVASPELLAAYLTHSVFGQYEYYNQKYVDLKEAQES